MHFRLLCFARIPRPKLQEVGSVWRPWPMAAIACMVVGGHRKLVALSFEKNTSSRVFDCSSHCYNHAWLVWLQLPVIWCWIRSFVAFLAHFWTETMKTWSFHGTPDGLLNHWRFIMVRSSWCHHVKLKTMPQPQSMCRITVSLGVCICGPAWPMFPKVINIWSNPILSPKDLIIFDPQETQIQRPAARAHPQTKRVRQGKA